MEVATFTCTICGDASTEICVYCTKDTCSNHLCDRCKRCSDCCECELSGVRVTENHDSGDDPVLSPVSSGHDEEAQ